MWLCIIRYIPFKLSLNMKIFVVSILVYQTANSKAYNSAHRMFGIWAGMWQC